MDMQDQERIELECYLRGFRPQAPPENLHQSILSAALRRAGTARRWRVALYVAALALISTSLPLNAWIERDDASPPPPARHIAIQLLHEELKRS